MRISDFEPFILPLYYSDMNTRLSLTPMIPNGGEGQDAGEESQLHSACKVFKSK